MVSVAKLSYPTAWEDEFQQPGVDVLRGNIQEKQLAKYADTARDYLLGIDDITETVEWKGLPWRWTLTYRRPMDTERPFAFLVTDPVMPKLGMPLALEFLQSLPMRRIKKFVREGMAQAKVVGYVYWSVWDLGAKSQLEDVLDLVKRRAAFDSPKR